MKKTAYIIGITLPSQGLITLYKYVVSHIMYAEEKGYIPIVDFKHYSNQYFKDGRIFKDNTWEYFFKQPTKYTLDDLDEFDEIIFSDNVEWADKKYNIIPPILTENIDLNENSFLKKYSEYFKFSDEMQTHLDKKFEEKIGNQEVLGILCRGTDYVNLKPVGHSVQPTAEQFIAKTKEVLEKYPNITKIYLATEDKEIYQKFQAEFSNMLISNDQYLFDKTESKALTDIKVEKPNHFYNLGKDYLTSLYILSKLKYFIAGRNNGSLGVFWLSSFFKNQEYFYIFNLGMYGRVHYSNIFEKIFSIKKEEFISRDSNRHYTKSRNKVFVTILGIKFSFEINKN